MANHAEPDIMAGAASDSATSQSEAAMQDASLAPAGSIGEGSRSIGEGGRPIGEGGRPIGPHPSYHGRKVSWVAVAIVMAGFLVGGLAMIFGKHGPIWWLFWAGAGITVLGLLISLATNTFEDWY